MVLTVFWLFVNYRKGFFFGIFFLIFIIPFKRYFNYNFSQKENHNLTVMSFNAANGSKGEQTVKRYIYEKNPDILFFQESRFHKSENLKLVKLPYNSKCYLVQTYSKYPIIRQNAISDSYLFYGGSVSCDVKINGKVVRFINVYLETFRFRAKEPGLSKLNFYITRLSDSFKIHEIQLNAIEKAVKESPYPVILGGDFNATPHSFEYYKIQDILEDAQLKSGSGNALSFYNTPVPLRIDYIFSSENLKPVSYKVDHSVILSDHFPVIATFKIP